MKKEIGLLFHLLLSVAFIYGQAFDAELSNIDSARRKANEGMNNISRANLLIRLANYYNESKLDLALYYAQEALQLSNNINYKRGVGEAYGAICYIYKGYGDYPKALEYGLIALHIFQETNDPQELATCNNRLGHISLYQNNLNDAIIYYTAALKLDEKIKRPSTKDSYEAVHLSNLSNILFKLNLLDSALVIGERANDLFRRPMTNHKYMGTGLVRIAKVYRELGQNVFALEYCKQGIQKSFEFNNLDNAGDGFLELAEIYFRKGLIDSSLRNAKCAMKLYTQLNAKNGLIEGSLI